MVDISSKTPFFARQLWQLASSRTGLLLLQFGAPATVAETNTLERVPLMDRAVAKGESSQRLKGSLGFLVELIGVSHLRKDTHGNGCAQQEPRAHIVVAKLMQIELTEGSLLPGQVADPIARDIGGFQGLFEKAVLFGRRLKFDARN